MKLSKVQGKVSRCVIHHRNCKNPEKAHQRFHKMMKNLKAAEKRASVKIVSVDYDETGVSTIEWVNLTTIKKVC